MMKSILISLLLIISLNAQKYVNRDASGSGDGDSWANAYTSLDQIEWGEVSAGDTIYVSGGSDSTVYRTKYTGFANGLNTVVKDSPYLTFASGNPVVISKSSESGHNGDVYFMTMGSTQAYLFHTKGLSNIKFVGLKFYDLRESFTGYSGLLYIGGGDVGDIDSLIYFENCEVVGKGQGTLFYTAGTKVSLRSCLIRQTYNELEWDQDPFGFSSGQGGYTIDSCRIEYLVNDLVGGESAHRDVLQFSNYGRLSYTGVVTITIKNSIIIQPYDNVNWTGIIYSSTPQTATDWYIYNNIFYSDNTSDGVTPIYLNQPDTAHANRMSVHLLNNTIIINSEADGSSTPIAVAGGDDVFQNYGVDTLIVKNNLIVTRAPVDIFLNLRIMYPANVYYRDFDNNIYAEHGGISNPFTNGEGFGNYTYTDWIGDGYDANSDTMNATLVSFTEEGGYDITDYYTTTGRDLGIDLSADYPFLVTDILGNRRDSLWDIGALEYPTIQHNKWVGLGHSVMRRYNDYSLVFEDSTAPTAAEEIYRQFNSQYEWGADSIVWDWKYFPETPYGTDWINWLYCFRGEMDDTSDNWLTSIINEYELIIVKGGIQTCDMTDLYGSSADTSGAGVTKKSVYNYKWIWREMLEYMEAQPDKFFVLMPGSGSGDYKALGSQVGIVAKEFATWAEDTLQAGLDPIYGAFPENVYVFNQFKYLTDSEGWLKDEYESRTPDEDDHPNATAMTYVVPLFVQEIGDAVLAWEGNQIPDPPPAVIDSLPNAFTFTDITNATRSTLYTSNGVTLTGFDSAYAYASGNTYTVNAGSDLTGYTKVFPNDVLRLKLTSSASYSTGVSNTLNVGGRTDTYTVTTEAAPYVPPSGNGGWVKSANGKPIYDSTGKRIITR